MKCQLQLSKAVSSEVDKNDVPFHLQFLILKFSVWFRLQYILKFILCSQATEYRNYKPESEEDYNIMYWGQTELMDGEDGEMSWFNAGVRVGVGIGLGICVGVGVGLGLLVRTTRNLRRRLM